MHKVIITADLSLIESIKDDLFALGADDIEVMSFADCMIANVPEHEIANIIKIDGVFTVEKDECESI